MSRRVFGEQLDRENICPKVQFFKDNSSPTDLAVICPRETLKFVEELVDHELAHHSSNLVFTEQPKCLHKTLAYREFAVEHPKRKPVSGRRS